MIFFSADFGWLALFIFVFTGSYVFPTLVFCTFLPSLLFFSLPFGLWSTVFSFLCLLLFCFPLCTNNQTIKNIFFIFFCAHFVRRVSIFCVFRRVVVYYHTLLLLPSPQSSLPHFWVQLFQFITLLYKNETNLSVLYYILLLLLLLLFCFN